MKIDYEKYMKIAIEEALFGKKNNEPPFGAILINKNGNIIARAHDTVVKEHDMTCHAELNVVKIASSKIGPDLSGCTVICTCEPCPLCFTASWLSRVSTIVFGSTISDVLKVAKNTQRELNIPVKFMNNRSGKCIKIVKDILRDECIKLWEKH